MESHDLGPQRRPRNWRNGALGVAVVVAIILIAQNAQKVKVDFLFIHTTTPLIFALLIATLLGVVIGYVLPLVRRHRRGD
jgi:uncharacterized integral membrane protein